MNISQYTIKVQAADAPQPVEQGIALAAGDNKKISLEITRIPKEPAKDPNAGGTVDPGYPNGEDKGSGTRTLGWIAIGVGAASLVGSGVTFLLYNGAKSDLETACGGGADWENTCPTRDKTEAQDIIDRGKLMGTLSPIFLGVGVVGVGAGIALLATSPSKSTGKGLTVHPGLGRIDATWRF